MVFKKSGLGLEKVVLVLLHHCWLLDTVWIALPSNWLFLNLVRDLLLARALL